MYPDAPIAILSALAEEQEGLLEHLQDARQLKHGGRVFWTGRMQGLPVVLALSRIGKVAAATTATGLITHFGASRVLFTGVAGGVGPGVQVGDVVVGSHYVQHDMDASPLFPRFEIPLCGQALFVADAALLATACVAFQRVQPALRTSQYKAQLHQGLLASGDRFVSSAAEVAALLDALASSGHHPLAVEMEGAAVAQVCADYGVPFVAMRTISDRADDTAHVDFPQFVRETASHYARAIVLEMLALLSKI
nr:5'-methylthioadenosine/adenosylhomocysteine nucleosidase [uncultured Rhodoferax sp.]